MSVRYKIVARSCAAIHLGLGLFLALQAGACNSIRNGWLDPTVVGNFKKTSNLGEIRSSLTLDDLPSVIPGATAPQPQDFEVRVEDYPIIGGDTLDIEINELRQRQVAYRTQIQVSPSGFVNLPVVGRVKATGFTPMEFQEELRHALQDRTVLVDPEVTVNPLFLGTATYSIFGVGVSASNTAPLRAGTFPIRRPTLRLLEAINQVGGLNEFVTEVYVFRRDDLAYPTPDDETEHETSEQGAAEETEDTSNGDVRAAEPESTRTPEQELLDVITDSDPTQEPPADTEAAEVPEELEPEPIDPYIFVNGEFVPNPDYSGEEPEIGPAPPPSFQTITPAVNWARLAGDTSYRIIAVPADLLRAGDQSVNMFVRAGDTIRIVSGEIGVYYVMGQVNRIGPFAFNAEPITLKAAIAAAGGLSGLAWPSRCTVYRRIGPREQMIQVDLDRVFAGLDADFYIKRGDIINVGTHPLAPFLQRVRAFTLPNPVNNLGYSFTYSRNFADIDSFAVKQNPANVQERTSLFSP